MPPDPKVGDPVYVPILGEYGNISMIFPAYTKAHLVKFSDTREAIIPVREMKFNVGVCQKLSIA